MYRLLILVLVASAQAGSTNKCSCIDDVGIADTYCGHCPTHCKDSKYRSYDGSCNNLKKGWWGKADSPYKRLCSPCSAECYTTLNNTCLPNARQLSKDVFVPLDVKDKFWTLLFMQFGQFLAHDMARISIKEKAGTCCSDGKLTSKAKTDKQCAHITVPKYDSYYWIENVTCLDFNRVETTHDRPCKNLPDIPAPLNSVTAVIDLSHVYGVDEQTAKSLRSCKGGKLKYVTRNGIKVPTQVSDPQKLCNVNNNNEACYKTGDIRANQYPELAMFHIIFMQEHNKIAEALAEVNCDWDDETLYQEARRINIAVFQCITYNEYLPGILGEDYMVKNKLIYKDAKGFIKDYDSKVNPAISNEFTTTAFRLFHTQVQGYLRSMTESRKTCAAAQLSDWFNNPSIIEKGENFKGFTIGMATQPSGGIDRYVPEYALTQLFKKAKCLLGGDLKATDIQRGRDHGVCSLVQIIKKFGLGNPKCFDDLREFLDPRILEILKKHYDNYECTELFAVFLEYVIDGIQSGRIVREIINEQFLRTRIADRYFYENEEGKGAFTKKQLVEIRKLCSMTRILCGNKEIEKMQPNAFLQISDSNKLKNCKTYHKMDLSAWKEKKDYHYHLSSVKK